MQVFRDIALATAAGLCTDSIYALSAQQTNLICRCDAINRTRRDDALQPPVQQLPIFNHLSGEHKP